MDQRDYPRFEVNARCHLSGIAPFEGVTQNISRNGVLIRLGTKDAPPSLPNVGDSLTVDIELPANQDFGQKYLHCFGTVVRTFNARRSLPCFALSISQMEFRGSTNGNGNQTYADNGNRDHPSRKEFALLFGGQSRRKRSGHAVVETALMAPWIFLLFLGVFDVGFYAYAGIMTANAARVAALYTSSSIGAANDSTGACGYALEEMRDLPNLGSSGACPSSDLTATAAKSTDTDGSTISTVTVTYKTVALFPIPGLAGSMTITRTAQMRARAN
jgi:hypothetical protein